jgi:hypothetical protein
MIDEVVALDGNAAAGTLARCFAVDVTRVIVACAGCGAEAQIGQLRLYGGPMGIILRCAACGEVNLRALEIGATLRLDARGASYLTVDAGDSV